MPRRKLPVNTSSNHVAEVCRVNRVDLADELLKMAQYRMRVPEDADPKVMAQLMKDYDLEIEPDGTRWFVRDMETRKSIFLDLLQYCAPRLRSSETKEEKDYNLTITIKTFGPEEQAPAIDVTQAARLLPAGEPGK